MFKSRVFSYVLCHDNALYLVGPKGFHLLIAADRRRLVSNTISSCEERALAEKRFEYIVIFHHDDTLSFIDTLKTI